MNKNSICPDESQLERLLSDAATEPEQFAVSAHLESCDACRDRLESLAGKLDWPIEAGRNPDPGLMVPSGLMELVKNLPLATLETTISEQSETPEVSLDFLDESQKAGELGTLCGGRYGITDFVGQGGTGIVLKASDHKLGRLVAIKVLRSNVPQDVSRRFLAEAKAIAAIKHPHVVDIYDTFSCDNRQYIVMEFIDGSLEDRINKNGALSIGEILRIGHQTALGLAAIHEKGFVHRDIKPGNILIEGGVAPLKIADFGLACPMTNGQTTQVSMCFGTPDYMSPEQARGEALNQQSDLFSLGSVLYAMCTGHPPFHASTAQKTIDNVCNEMPLPIRVGNPTIPVQLVNIVDGLLEKDPRHRLSPAAVVAKLLDTYGQELVDCRSKTGHSVGHAVPHDLTAILEKKDGLFRGRQAELETLWDAWEDPSVTIVQITAGPGMGKSALVRRWARQFARKRYPDCTNSIGWSFYNQSEHSYSANANAWFDRADRHFRPRMTAEERADSHSMGLAIADQHIRQGGLMILDGLEPLLHQEQPYKGRLRQDPALIAMLGHLDQEQGNAGPHKRLLIITTRTEYHLFTSETKNIRLVDLNPLSEEEAAKLLQDFRLDTDDEKGLYTMPPQSAGDGQEEGRQERFKAIAREYGCHPLTLTLLASYFLRVHKGNLAMAGPGVDPVANATRPAPIVDENARHAQRVMSEFDKLFKSGTDRDRACRQLLFLLALLERPASLSLIQMMVTERIEGFSTCLRPEIAEDILAELKGLCLVSETEGISQRRFTAHPLIRGYFRKKFHDEYRQGWCQANQRLSKYYLESAIHGPLDKDHWGQPEYDRLYLAVVYGCNAGLHDDMFKNVYRRFITEGDWGMATRRFGVFSLERSVLRLFFDSDADEFPSPESARLAHEEDRITLLRSFGFCCWKLGQTDEAKRYMKAALERAHSFGDPDTAAIAARNLVNLLIDQGEFREAIATAKKNFGYADRTSDTFMSFGLRCSAGMACTYMAGYEEASEYFEEAKHKAKEKSTKGVLYFLPLCHYCEFLAVQGNGEAAIALLEQDLNTVSLMNTANVGLARLAMASVYNQMVKQGFDLADQALDYAKLAINDLNRAGRSDNLPDAHIVRAIAYFQRNEIDDWQLAMDDVNIALDLSDRADARRSRVWASVVEGLLWCTTLDWKANGKSPEECQCILDSCKNMVEEMEYKRLDDLIQRMEDLIRRTSK